MTWQLRTIVDERRAASRFDREPGSESALLQFADGRSIVAEVHDESLSGIGLLVEHPASCKVGQLLNLQYEGRTLSTTVRHVQAQADGRWLIGLECEAVKSENTPLASGTSW